MCDREEYEFRLTVLNCEHPIHVVAQTVEEAIGIMELSFPKWQNRKCIDFEVVRRIRCTC